MQKFCVVCSCRNSWPGLTDTPGRSLIKPHRTHPNTERATAQAVALFNCMDGTSMHRPVLPELTSDGNAILSSSS
ncbi:MAG: hypothetical protein K1X68_01335 [Saprospiraceae bacterium]|nr:hypothetical protein [Saprospiraceae bacterium]HMW39895.1 hypothetical protein [Saprospiraceae bacterium]HMX89140.1 hypothetical protein [Saprospiraceae bacterium]HMZ40799.1 hypothetical protein [Saprospiraceae bacterium]HNA64591.1 hypothetical protein [Saprospiraceae bacterium]